MSKIHEIINKSSNDDLLDNEKNFSYDEKQRISYDNFYISKITMKDGTVYDANEFNNSSSSLFAVPVIPQRKSYILKKF